MIMENNSANEKLNRIMGSLDGIRKAAAPDFFYTRLTGKMQPAAGRRSMLIIRPAFITAVLSVFLIINIFSLLVVNKPGQKPGPSNAAGTESFVNAYNMNTGSVYE